MFKFIAIRKL